MEKYKALKEYIQECEKKGIENSFINKLPIRNTSMYMQICDELNSFLKEHFGNNGFVTFPKDSVINDKA